MHAANTIYTVRLVGCEKAAVLCAAFIYLIISYVARQQTVTDQHSGIHPIIILGTFRLIPNSSQACPGREDSSPGVWQLCAATACSRLSIGHVSILT